MDNDDTKSDHFRQWATNKKVDPRKCVFKLEVPGNYTLVDHALSRLERGLSGILNVEGPPNPEIFNGKVMPGMGH